MLLTESLSKIFVCCLLVSLCGCSEIQTSKEYKFKYKSNRPDTFPPKELNIIIGKTTKNDIHSQFDVIFESENIIGLDPNDQKLKMLNVEHINVILDGHDIVIGVNVVYKSKTLELIPPSIMNN